MAVANQGLCSLSNFLAFAMVARASSLNDVGTYAVLFAVLTMLGGVQNALLTGPLKIFGGGLERGRQDEYFSQAFTLQICLASATALASGGLLYIWLDLGPMLAFVACCFFYQLQQYCRSQAITAFKISELIKTDVVTHSVRIAASAVALASGALDSTVAFWILAASSAAGLVGQQLQLSSPNLRTKATAFRHWHFGKWLLVETATFYSSTHIYVILVAAMLGAAAAGVLGAIQNLMNAVNVVSTGIASISPSIVRAQLMSEGYKGWMSSFRLFLVANVSVVSILVAVITIFGSLILDTLYGSSYAESSWLLAPLGAVSVLASINSVTAMAFRVIERPQVGAIAKTISGVASLLAAPLLLQNYGIAGAVAGLLLTQVLWCSFYLGYWLAGSIDGQAIDEIKAKNEPLASRD